MKETSKAARRFGSILRKLRKEKDITLEELAFRIGSDASHCSKIQRGQKELTLETAVKICEALEVDILVDEFRLTRSR